MPTLNIEGRRVKVDDSFLKLSPEDQGRTVDEIAASLKITPGAQDAAPVAPAEPTETPLGVGDVVRATATGVPILGGALNKANAAINAAVAPTLEPILTPGSPENIGDAPGGYGGRYEKSLKMQNERDARVAREHPIADTAAKVVGGVGATIPAVMAAPAAFGAVGTMGQMVGRGAVSGGAISAADAAVRGHDIAPEAATGAVLGAAGGPVGHAIGKVVSAVRGRSAAPLVPKDTINVAGEDITLLPRDDAAASRIEIARKGAAGDSAKSVVDEADAQVAAQVKSATESISAAMDPAGARVRATPAEAAEAVQSELTALEQTRFQTEQARLQRAELEGQQLRGEVAPDPYTGQPMNVADSPFAAAEGVGGAVAQRAEAARRGVRGQYEEANAVPGAYDPAVPRSMAEEIRARAAMGDEPLHVDPQSTNAAAVALRELDKTLNEGLFSNRAAPVGGVARDAGPVAPAAAPVAAAVQTDAEIAFAALTAKGASPERARAAVANLPGAEAIPRTALEPHSVSTAAGHSVDLVPKVVEARSVLTSADAGYDQTLQPRNRARAASDLQIQDMAKNITPNRLGVSAEADRGAPIIGPDGMTESGNGRVLALRQAYAENGAQAQKYRAWLESQGADVAGMKEPILVRERATPMSHPERQAFTVASNQSSTLSLSGAERALADSRALSPETLGLIRNAGDLGAVDNRDFVRQFMQSVPAAERGSLMTAGGDLSSEGLTRIRNAVMAKAYGNSSILARAAESTRDEIKAISSGLQAAAPEWAQLRSLVASGAVPKELDATVHLLDAVERTARLRGKGTSLAEGMAQSDAFATQSPESEAFMRLFYGKDGKTAASSSTVGNALRHYAQEAAKVDASPGLNLGMAPVTARDVLASTSAKVGAPAALAKEVSEAAQAAAIPAAESRPITEIGVREMDNARKRLNVLRGDAIKAAQAPGGSGADLRAMNRIIAEFDNVIMDAHAAGRFSGDSQLAQRLILQARAGHSAYRQTFTSRGGVDAPGRAVEKILGRYHDTAAPTPEILKMSYGSASNPGGSQAIMVAQRLRQILGPTSPEWGGFKQGLIDYVKGDAAAGPAKQGERLRQYLTGDVGRDHAAIVLSADERAAALRHADNLIAAEPRKLSELKGVDKKIAKITGQLDGVPASTREIVTDIYGSVTEAGSKGIGIAMIDRLKRDMTPEGFTAVKQGMLAHLLERPEGVTEWGFQKMSQNIYKFINGNGAEAALKLWGKDVADVRKLADAMAHNVPPPGTTNPSGTAPMLTKIARGMASWVLPVIGFSHGGLIGAGAGVGVQKGVKALGDAKAAREVKNLIYAKSPGRSVDPRFARTGALIGQTGAAQIGNR